MMKNKMVKTMFLMGCTFLVMGATALAAPKAEQIVIEADTNTMQVGKTMDLDSEIRPEGAKVKDRNIIWSSSDSKVVKVLDKRDDDTKVKALKTGNAVISVRIKNTKIKADFQITVQNKKKGMSVKKQEKKIEGYKKQYDKVYSNIKSTKVGTDAAAAKQQYLKFERELDAIDRKADRLDDQIEDAYHDGKLSYRQRKSLDRKLDKLEDYKDSIENYLEDKYEFIDDDHDDYDDYDDFDD